MKRLVSKKTRINPIPPSALSHKHRGPLPSISPHRGRRASTMDGASSHVSRSSSHSPSLPFLEDQDSAEELQPQPANASRCAQDKHRHLPAVVFAYSFPLHTT